MAISTSRIKSTYERSISEYLEPVIKVTIAEQLGKTVEDLTDDDYKPFLRTIVEANVSLNELLIESIISEIKDNAEFEIPSADVGLDNTKVKVTIPIGVVSQGAGTAVITNPAPITISGNVISKKVSGKVKKGYIK